MTSPDRQGTTHVKFESFAATGPLPLIRRSNLERSGFHPEVVVQSMVLGPIFMSHPVTFQIEQAASLSSTSDTAGVYR